MLPGAPGSWLKLVQEARGSMRVRTKKIVPGISPRRPLSGGDNLATTKY